MRTEGHSFHTQNLKVVVRLSERARLGLVVSKKVSKRAVDRNKLKRRLRETYRRNAHLFPPQSDILLIAKPSALDVSGQELLTQLASMQNRLKKAVCSPATSGK